MYRFEIQGCLTIFFVICIFIFLIAKLWWLIVGLSVIGIVYYYSKLAYENISQNGLSDNKNYEPKEGEVYKVCPSCNAKVKVSATTCPRCKTPLN